MWTMKISNSKSDYEMRDAGNSLTARAVGGNGHSCVAAEKRTS